MKDSGRRWLIAAVALFLFLLVGWVLLALQLNVALAGPLPFGPGLTSRLMADYAADPRGRTVSVITLSIVDEAMQALGYSPEKLAAIHESMAEAMSRPVPTATARDFQGEAPYTPTPVATRTPPPTDLPATEPTEAVTRRPPTRTPEPTNTKKPTKTPGGPTATGTGDSSDPVVDVSGADINPDFGAVGSCSVTITASNVHIVDPGVSSGIAWVKLKYFVHQVDDTDEIYIPPYVYSAPFVLVDGVATDGYYSGYLSIEVYPGWSPLENEGPEDFEVELYIKVLDNSGKDDVIDLGDYTISDECDDPPAPTDTPTRTPTASPTIEETPTATPTT